MGASPATELRSHLTPRDSGAKPFLMVHCENGSMQLRAPEAWKQESTVKEGSFRGGMVACDRGPEERPCGMTELLTGD